MMQRRTFKPSLLAATLTLLTAVSAKAASLQQVTADWKGGVSGLPSDVTMYVYVPDKVATNPPILTLVHYCGGTASAVFGQAQGGGIVKAADQYGFIMVVPSSGRCWDVVSSKTRTRDGGGDTHAIVQMVRYAITKYQANADRVYSTGDSSGGMTTQLLLGLYPDIFKAGASMAGMPAGCGTTTSSPGGYDGACASGTVTHTAQEWGDIVRKMYPGYTGHRARVQLFHGTADQPGVPNGYISFKNQAESTKEWSNVLGLSATPTSTETGLTLGTHQATRDKWLNSCGYLVLDAFASIDGDHGPSDALFLSQYLIPFLGLDKTGAVDPEIAQCGGGTGDAGAGGAGAGGATGAGGSTTARDGGQGGRDVGSAGAGGSAGSTGSASSGGSSGAGGSPAAGGSVGSGGNSSKGGAQGTGGSQASGGNAAGGTASGTGGAQGSGGAVGSGGQSSTGGSAGNGSGGKAGSGGATAGSTGGGTTANGCSCALGTGNSGKHGVSALALGLALAIVPRIRRRRR